MSVIEAALRYAPNLVLGIAYPTEKTQSVKSIDLYTVFWMFTFGSVMGYVVETLFCLATKGQYQNRSSMLVSPFNIIYGIGAMALYIGLHKISSKNIPCVFGFGMVMGTTVEFIASWVQQTVFGSVSWDYSNLPLNIGGRISLLFAFFWGALAVIWIKSLQPLLERMIAIIPKQIGKRIAVCLLVFLIFDAAIAVVAVARWGMRLDGIPAGSAVIQWIDRLFPDMFMEKVYANMTHIQ